MNNQFTCSCWSQWWGYFSSRSATSDPGWSIPCAGSNLGVLWWGLEPCVASTGCAEHEAHHPCPGTSTSSSSFRQILGCASANLDPFPIQFAN